MKRKIKKRSDSDNLFLELSKSIRKKAVPRTRLTNPKKRNKYDRKDKSWRDNIDKMS